MPDIGYADHASIALTQPAPSARGRRALLAAIVAAAAAVGALATGHQAASQAIAQSGAELTQLLRAMAGMKAMAAAALVGVMLWRLTAPATRARFAVYALAGAAMAAGPGLIWSMAHLKLGALLLHGGLFVAVVALWRDPAMGRLLEGVIARRRRKEDLLF